MLRQPCQHATGKVNKQGSFLALKHGSRIFECKHLVRDELGVSEFALLVVVLGKSSAVGAGEKVGGWRTEEADHLGETGFVGKAAVAGNTAAEEVDVSKEFP